MDLPVQRGQYQILNDDRSVLFLPIPSSNLQKKQTYEKLITGLSAVVFFSVEYGDVGLLEKYVKTHFDQ